MPRSQRLGTFALLLAGAWLLFGAYVVDPLLPFHPVRLPLAWRLQTSLWAPEGWGFFTRDPREPGTFLFKRTEAGWTSASLAPSFRPATAFGLDRRARFQRGESAALLRGAPGAPWTECRGEPVRCLDRAGVGATLHNQARPRTLCGTVGFVSRPPVPWAWTRSRTPVRMTAKVLKLEVAC